MLHQKDFHDYPYCPRCYTDVSSELEDISTPDDWKCPNCGSELKPEIRSARDQYEDYGDMKYHELKDEGLI